MRRRAGFLILLAAWLAPIPAAADGLDTALRSVVSVLPEWPPESRRTEEPEGSGVVVLDGHSVLTAAHVVNRALSVRVRTADGDIVNARIKGRDLATDIALLTIDRALPAIGVDDGEPELGDRVCAIGNSFGLGLSVTCGVVSGVHRAGVGFNVVEDFVQTDAAVNPGASGGALVTGEGKMVGLLSAIFTKKADANIGVNFAVSAPLALDTAKALSAEGRVRRPASGLRLARAPEAGGTGRQGARVVSVRPGYPGEKAGIKAGDIIVRAGGRRVRKPADFVSVMSGLGAAGSLDVEVTRDGEALTLRLAP